MPLRQLELELTESALVTDIAQVAARLVRLRDHGFKIALDDFGTGHSALSHLRALPFHKVKIDRSFVNRRRQAQHHRAARHRSAVPKPRAWDGG